MFTSEECLACRRDFPALERRQGDLPVAYLDGPAGTQVPQAVIDAITWYYRTCNVNARGRYAASQETDEVLQQSREAVAALLGAPSWREISFGLSMTSLTFLLARALARQMEPGDEIVITELDHEANRGPWLDLREQGIVVQEVRLETTGRLDLEDLRRKVSARTKLVAMGLASNALGTVNDVELARDLSRDVGAYLLLDAVHYAPHFPLDVTALDVDFLLCSAYKFYGPHVGILYTRPGLLDRLATDHLGTQPTSAPHRIETGTLNHAAIVGVRAAIEYIASWGEGPDPRSKLVSAVEAIAAWEHEVARHYYENVRQLPGVTVWGPDFTDRLRAPTVSITIDGVDPAAAAKTLDTRAIQVRDGHFYAARAVEVLGLAERGGLVRIGVSMYNTLEEIDRLLEGVAALGRQ
ncbi:MAG: cysteine desulfurase-like protein [Thermoanaerobaculia bacterium]